uniref:Probable protein E5 n=1 Tax=Human papillomavirus 31 TaxID=10585 RepID=A0A8F8APT7_HPV31|nr:replication protein [human papillomavirus 31]
MIELDISTVSIVLCFLLCFCVLLFVCLVIRPLVLSVSVYATLLLLIVILWVIATSALRCFCIYIPLFVIHTHASILSQQ